MIGDKISGTEGVLFFMCRRNLASLKDASIGNTLIFRNISF